MARSKYAVQQKWDVNNPNDRSFVENEKNRLEQNLRIAQTRLHALNLIVILLEKNQEVPGSVKREAKADPIFWMENNFSELADLPRMFIPHKPKTKRDIDETYIKLRDDAIDAAEQRIEWEEENIDDMEEAISYYQKILS